MPAANRYIEFSIDTMLQVSLFPVYRGNQAAAGRASGIGEGEMPAAFVRCCLGVEHVEPRSASENGGETGDRQVWQLTNQTGTFGQIWNLEDMGE